MTEHGIQQHNARLRDRLKAAPQPLRELILEVLARIQQRANRGVLV